MSLSCECNDSWDGQLAYYPPSDYSRFISMRRKRCCSCVAYIRPGDTVAKFERFRGTHNDIEERIHGEQVPLAAHYMCERCADLYFSIDELGFCINLGDDMRLLVKEYSEVYGQNNAS